MRRNIGENPDELSVKTLSGGISAEVFEIKTVTERYVMKRYTNEQWISEEPDLVKHEVASLKFVEKAGLPVPRVIAFDETGKDSGAPSIVMSKIDGSPVIMPENNRAVCGWSSEDTGIYSYVTPYPISLGDIRLIVT